MESYLKIGNGKNNLINLENKAKILSWFDLATIAIREFSLLLDIKCEIIGLYKEIII